MPTAMLPFCPAAECTQPCLTGVVCVSQMLTFCTASAASAAALLAAAAGPVSSGFMAGNNNTSCRTQPQAEKTTNNQGC